MTNKDFSKLDPIVPESNERIGRGRPVATNKGSQESGSRSSGPKKDRGHPNDSYSAPKNGMWFWKFLVLLLIVGLGGLGYFFVEQTERLSILQGRFNELEAKIVSTDESLNESGTALAVKLKDQAATLDKHWSEIKKLWGVSNDRNRKNIEAQQKTLATQSKSIQNLQGSMSARKKEVSSLTGKLDKTSKSLDMVVNSSLAAKLEINDLMGEFQQNTDKMNNLEKGLSVLKQNLNTRVAGNEEAINAIDAYRLQVNREIQLLKQQLSNSASGNSTSTTP